LTSSLPSVMKSETGTSWKRHSRSVCWVALWSPARCRSCARPAAVGVDGRLVEEGVLDRSQRQYCSSHVEYRPTSTVGGLGEVDLVRLVGSVVVATARSLPSTVSRRRRRPDRRRAR
jgi:hypothetical protein